MDAPTPSSHYRDSCDAELAAIVETAVEQLQAGQPIDIEGLAAAHPRWADELRNLLSTAATMVGLGDLAQVQQNGYSTESVSDSPTGPRRLGDFRLIRVLGQGGMGIVYEAEQLSMGRRVALKVLPFMAVAQEHALQRFRNEVRAAAALDHPHIVSVYSIGEERGVHFYAMQLVRGRTLTDYIADIKANQIAGNTVTSGTSPIDAKCLLRVSSANPDSNIFHSTSRSHREHYQVVARLGIQAADALQHAHEQGVLHRDVKPGNLMLDSTGKLYITDFGLARIGSEVGLTSTGDLIGTLRYMAPEQALGNRVVIDQRADIYSLGATLYELLTLQPVFSGSDRAELMRQIALEETRPPRQLDRRVPVELDTILLKAIAKEPEERYQTARQLGDDLQAFLEHRPIHARPPSWFERLQKWSRRHGALVRVSLLSLVLVFALMMTSMFLVQRAQTRTVAALAETSDLLYTADVALAYQAYEKGWPDESRRILERHLPQKTAFDRRGLEWFLLNQAVQTIPSAVFRGHVGPVNEIAVFPDHQRIVSVGEDATLRIWEIATRKCRLTFHLGNEGLHSVTVSPNGRYVAAGGTTGFLCDLVEGGDPRTFFRSANNCTIESLAFSPDGQRIAVGERYDGITLVSLDGKVVNHIPCRARVESLEYLPDSTILLPNRRDNGAGVLQIWDSELANVRKQLDCSQPGDLGLIAVGRASASGRFVVAGENRKSQARVLDVKRGEVLTTTTRSRDMLTDAAYSPAGEAIALAFNNGQVKYYAMECEGSSRPTLTRPPLIFDAHQGATTHLQFLDARNLLTCGADSLVRIWSLPAPVDVGYRVGGKNGVNGLKASPTGSRILCTSRDGYSVIDMSTGKPLLRHDEDKGDFAAPAWALQEEVAAVACNRRNQVLLLAPDGETVQSLPATERIDDIAFSPDGVRLATIGPKYLQIYDVVHHKQIFQQHLTKEGTSVCFSHDGSLLAYAGKFDRLVLLDAATHRVVGEFASSIEAECIAFSPDDRYLAAGHSDSVIRLWNLPSRQLQAELVGHDGKLGSLAFSDDGRTLFSAADDGAVRLWSVERGCAFGVFCQRPEALEPGSAFLPCRLTLPPNGSYLAVGYLTNTQVGPDVLVWRLGRGDMQTKAAPPF